MTHIRIKVQHLTRLFEMVDFCTEQFGESKIQRNRVVERWIGGTWRVKMVWDGDKSHYKFIFTRSEQATLFSLKFL